MELRCACGSTWWRVDREVQVRAVDALQALPRGYEAPNIALRTRLTCVVCGANAGEQLPDGPATGTPGP